MWNSAGVNQIYPLNIPIKLTEKIHLITAVFLNIVCDDSEKKNISHCGSSW